VPLPAWHIHLALRRERVAGEIEVIKVLGEELAVLTPDSLALDLEEEAEVAVEDVLL
jgi:hypothetical protein